MHPHKRVESYRASFMYSDFNKDENLNPNILKEIEPIHFSQLTGLFFYNNKIESIENICRLRLPLLEDISFGIWLLYEGDNKILTVKVFRKTLFLHLKTISFRKNYNSDDNKIIDGQYLPTTKFSDEI